MPGMKPGTVVFGLASALFLGVGAALLDFVFLSLLGLLIIPLGLATLVEFGRRAVRVVQALSASGAHA